MIRDFFQCALVLSCDESSQRYSNERVKKIPSNHVTVGDQGMAKKFRRIRFLVGVLLLLQRQQQLINEGTVNKQKGKSGQESRENPIQDDDAVAGRQAATVRIR